MDERNARRCVPGQNRKRGNDHAFVILQVVNARQIQHIGLRGANGVFRPRGAAPLPLEVMAGRDDAAPLAHAIPEHGLLRRGFSARIDDGSAIGEGIPPTHGKGLDILPSAVRQHRDDIGGAYFAGGFQPRRRLFPVQRIHDPAPFLRHVIFGNAVASAHNRLLLSLGRIHEQLPPGLLLIRHYSRFSDTLPLDHPRRRPAARKAGRACVPCPKAASAPQEIPPARYSVPGRRDVCACGWIYFAERFALLHRPAPASRPPLTARRASHSRIWLLSPVFGRPETEP